MKRQAIIIKTSGDGKTKIAIDEKNFHQIYGYINRDARHKRKFNDICNIILSGLRNTDLYDKENINSRCNDVTAMKFFKGQENDRLYCKEIRNKQEKVFIVVTSELLEKKKNQKNKQREINVIEKVAGYEYEIK
mgnify:CR=1 FL=1